jgi:hypothetical protein
MKIRSVLGMASFAFLASASTALAAVPLDVPEPMTMSLLAAGAAGLIAYRKFRGK